MFDSITLFDFWDGPSFGIGKRGRQLLRRGTQASATIVGIKVSRTGSDSDSSNTNHYFYALEVAQPLGPPIRLGCRQYLTPHRAAVGLGAEVVVRYRGWRVIIDWTATLDRLGLDHGAHADCADLWKPKRKVIEPGLQDHEQNGARRRVNGGRAAKATILRINALDGIFGTVQNVDVDVLLTYADGKTAQGLLRKIVPPDYAAGLLTVGTVLPVGVDKGGERITVDWVAAANGGTSVDPAPPAAGRDAGAPLPPTSTDRFAAVVSGLVASTLERNGMPAEAPGGETIDFDTFVAVSAGLARDAVPPGEHDAYAVRHGVPAGHWGPASRAWQARMAADWKLGSKYGDAYARAMQGGPGGGGGAGFGAG